LKAPQPPGQTDRWLRGDKPIENAMQTNEKKRKEEEETKKKKTRSHDRICNVSEGMSMRHRKLSESGNKRMRECVRVSVKQSER
jgi:hypothetical protein